MLITLEPYTRRRWVAHLVEQTDHVAKPVVLNPGSQGPLPCMF